MLYKISAQQTLAAIPNKKVLERDVQRLIEKNLDQLFQLEFVATEFSIANVRFDTLAFDREANAPIIIEYKKGFEKSLFDQGLEYLNLLFSRKADFAIELHRKLKLPADPDQIEWGAARVIFVSSYFSARQKRAISFRGLPVELWRFDWLENDCFELEKEDLEKEAKLEEFTKNVGSSTAIAKVKRELTTFDRAHHQKRTSEAVWELFEKFENEILSLGNIEQKYKHVYISFCKNGRSFCSIEMKKNSLNINFRGQESELKKFSFVEDVRKVGHWGPGDFRVNVADDKNWNEIIFFIRKSYETIS